MWTRARSIVVLPSLLISYIMWAKLIIGCVTDGHYTWQRSWYQKRCNINPFLAQVMLIKQDIYNIFRRKNALCECPWKHLARWAPFALELLFYSIDRTKSNIYRGFADSILCYLLLFKLSNLNLHYRIIVWPLHLFLLLPDGGGDGVGVVGVHHEGHVRPNGLPHRNNPSQFILQTM